MNSTRGSKKGFAATGLLLVAIAGGFAGDKVGRKADGVPLAYKQVPGPTVTVTAAPAPVVEDATPAAPARKIERRAVAPRVRRPATQEAQYRIMVACGNSVRRQDGTSRPGGARAERQELRAGLTLRYDFSYQREESENPVVEQTKACTISTERLRDGAEPDLSVLLSCDGEATYTANPQPTSTDAGSWRPAELISGHTHTMTAPKSPEHMSEHVRCTVSAVAI